MTTARMTSARTQLQTQTRTWYRDIDSALGCFRCVIRGEALHELLLPQRRHQGRLLPLDPPPADWQHDDQLMSGLSAQLLAYFAGDLKHFDIDDFGLPLAARGTEFQQTVWRQLLTIPYGRTCTYAELAREIDRPTAVRAVGTANGANPWPVIVPCHRVVGSDGQLHGYAGGLQLKQQLLALEQSGSVATRRFQGLAQGNLDL